MTTTLHQIDFTFVEPGMGGMEMHMDPKLTLEQKMDLAYEELNDLYPEYEDTRILKIEDTDITDA